LTNDRANCGQISPGFEFLLAEAPRALARAGASDTRMDPFDLERMFDLPAAVLPDRRSLVGDEILCDLELNVRVRPDRRGSRTDTIVTRLGILSTVARSPIEPNRSPQSTRRIAKMICASISWRCSIVPVAT
ncbi:MAG: hypothetical protein HC778_08260, partial [Chamaesiphon sp. CSU_1_12]|nr:hypothetical protein [Chamaesiphon sp. CSU_1_12]